ncbi:MAG: trigger factor [Acidothermus sp.]|nr:trigger factor [Acidothermus sp.]MCL6537957.1 trigger factor [Acidothermus sp.]
MKSAVETLSPTRVKFTVEVGFDELQPSVAAAYRKVAQQVRIPGFRPGKVPPPIIDRRIGRGFVLEQAVNDAIPDFYTKAVEEADVAVLAQPQIEVTKFEDGEGLTFTAEVDVRPKIELPDPEEITVTVDPAEVAEADVDAELAALADRFATLSPVERPARRGDFVTIDMVLTLDGEELEDGSVTGASYEVGSGQLVEGLDEALEGLAVDQSAEFDAPLAGPYEGRVARARVTVRAVREKSTPALDDAFAKQASEFDTLDELRADVRERLRRVRRIQQVVQARERLVDTLLEKLDIPLPERLVENEIAARAERLRRFTDARGITVQEYLARQGETAEQHDAHTRADVEREMRVQFLLDTVVARYELSLEEAEFTDYLIQRATRLGVNPDDYANQLVRTNTVPLAVADALRGKALAYLLQHVRVVDPQGEPVVLEGTPEPAAIGGQ